MTANKTMWPVVGSGAELKAVSLTPEHDRLAMRVYDREVIRHFVAWLFASDPECRKSGYPWSEKMVDEEIARFFEADFDALAQEEKALQAAVETAVRDEVARCVGHK